MSLENAKVLHKKFLALGRKDLAEQQEKNYPELKATPAVEPKPIEEPKEVKKDGNNSSNRKKR